MNVVPGMITQFSFTPTVTTDEINETEYMRDKVRMTSMKLEERKAKNRCMGEEPLAEYEQLRILPVM